MKAVGYIRVSTEEQADSGLGLEAQRAVVNGMAAAKQWDLTAIVEDAGVSGKSTDRPGLREVMAQVKGKVIDAVIIAKLDRISRNTRDLLDLAEEFERRKVALISTSESIDTSTASGRMLITILAAVATFEREAISERTSAALQAKKARGERVGTIPYGKRLDANGDLVDNPDELAAAARMSELRSDGMAYEAIAQAITAEGVRTRRGGAFSRQGIHKLLRSINLDS